MNPPSKDQGKCKGEGNCYKWGRGGVCNCPQEPQLLKLRKKDIKGNFKVTVNPKKIYHEPQPSDKTQGNSKKIEKMELFNGWGNQGFNEIIVKINEVIERLND